MSSTIRRAVVPSLAALALAAAVAGCGSDSNTATDGASTGASSDGGAATGLSGDLNGGGSSAQGNAQMAWTAGFQQANPDVTVNYDPVGSGGGRESFISGAYSFAGSDSALSDDDSEGDSELTQAKATCGADALEVPAYISPIAVVYNLPGVDTLQLKPATVADIFSGKITKWNDAEIAADNEGVSLPDTTITPVHRSDDSGTTTNFTDWLSQTAPDNWKYPSDDTWPINSGTSGDQTSGLIAKVKGGEGSIGYADYSQSGGLGVAKIGVGDTYNAPSAAGAAATLAASPVAEGRPDGDIAITIDRTITDASAYPLILTSYLIACPSYKDSSTAALVKGYLSYAVSSAGQQAAAQAAGSAPLPDDLASQAADIVNGIS